ncbi:13910_t:CDS:2, partial [Acaulospora colombiana]
ASFSAASVSGVFQASLSSELAQQTRDGSNSDTINTAFVSPSDPRIEYDPASAWQDTSSTSGVGSCNNATRVTTQANASFKFVFEGSISVSVDGESASTVNTAGGTSTNQCVSSQVYSRSDLPEKPHIIIVKNALNAQGSSGGKLEFNGITYVHFILHWSTFTHNTKVILERERSARTATHPLATRKKNKQAGQPATPAPTTPNQPILFSPNPGQQAPYSPPMHTGSPPMSEYNAYGGMQQPPPGSYQIPPSPGQSGWGSPQQYPQQMYQDPARPVSGTSGAGMAPLPMWVERAQAPSGEGGMSTTSATYSGPPSHPPYQGGYQQQGY